MYFEWQTEYRQRVINKGLKIKIVITLSLVF